MAVSTNKGYELQATGTNNNTWGDVLNTQVIARIDTNLGGVVTKTLSNVDVTLTTDESRNLQIVLTGALSGNVIVTTPGIGFYTVRNYTTGNFLVTLQYTGGVGAKVIPPQGCSRQIIIDSTNGCFAVGLDMPGTYKEFAAGTSALPLCLTGEYLLCDGSNVSRSTYAQLFNVLGTTYGVGDGTTTFGLPDLRGRSLFGLDNMGGSTAGRITNAGSGIVGTTMGASGGAQTVTLAQSDLPNVTLSGTTNTTGAHTHTTPVTGGSGAGSNPAGALANTGETGSAGLHSHTVTTSSINGGVTQTAANKMPPAFICNIMIKT